MIVKEIMATEHITVTPGDTLDQEKQRAMLKNRLNIACFSKESLRSTRPVLVSA